MVGLIKHTLLAFISSIPVAMSSMQFSAKVSEQCLRRVSPMPRVEGYGALCASIEAMYQQQQTTATSFSALQEENDKFREEIRRLSAAQEKMAGLESELKEAKLQNLELRTSIGHFRSDEVRFLAERQAAAQSKRTLLVQRGVHANEEKAERDGVAELTKDLASARNEDASLHADVAHAMSEARRAEVTISFAQAGKKSAEEAATHAAILVHDAQRSRALDAAALMQQIQALQSENELLSKRCE